MVGTVFERSHIPLNKWLMAAFLLCASKKGMSAHQMHRMIGITYKSAWFMMHRLREAMRAAKDDGPKGGEGQVVEADETFIGGKERNKHVGKRDRKKIGGSGKEIAFALVQRGGKVRSFHVPAVNAKTLRPILVQQINRKTSLMTDGAGQYRHMGDEFDRHKWSTTKPTNTCVATHTPTPSRDISQFSSAASSARIITLVRSI
jgi:hypothetical protein